MHEHHDQHADLHRGVGFADERRRDFDVLEEQAVDQRAAENDQVANDDDDDQPDGYVPLEHKDEKGHADEQLVGQGIREGAELRGPRVAARQGAVHGVRAAGDRHEHERGAVLAVRQAPCRRRDQHDADDGDRIGQLPHRQPSPIQVSVMGGPAASSDGAPRQRVVAVTCDASGQAVSVSRSTP